MGKKAGHTSIEETQTRSLGNTCWQGVADNIKLTYVRPY